MEIIYVDSQYKLAGTPSSFRWHLQENVTLTEFSHCRVDQIRLVNSFRTIDVDNCYIYWDYGTGMVYSRLEVGTYSGQELADHPDGHGHHSDLHPHKQQSKARKHR